MVFGLSNRPRSCCLIFEFHVCTVNDVCPRQVLFVFLFQGVMCVFCFLLWLHDDHDDFPLWYPVAKVFGPGTDRVLLSEEGVVIEYK